MEIPHSVFAYTGQIPLPMASHTLGTTLQNSLGKVKNAALLAFLSLPIAKAGCHSIRNPYMLFFSDPNNATFQINHANYDKVSPKNIMNTVAVCNVTQIETTQEGFTPFKKCICDCCPDEISATESVLDLYWKNEGKETANCLKSQLNKLCEYENWEIALIVTGSTLALCVVCCFASKAIQRDLGCCAEKDQQSLPLLPRDQQNNELTED